MTEQSLALAVPPVLSDHQGSRLIISALLTCHGAAPRFDLFAPQSLTSVGSFVNLEPAFEPQWLSALPGHGASITFIDHKSNYQRLKRLLGSKRDRKS